MGPTKRSGSIYARLRPRYRNVLSRVRLPPRPTVYDHRLRTPVPLTRNLQRLPPSRRASHAQRFGRRNSGRRRLHRRNGVRCARIARLRNHRGRRISHCKMRATTTPALRRSQLTAQDTRARARTSIHGLRSHHHQRQHLNLRLAKKNFTKR